MGDRSSSFRLASAQWPTEPKRAQPRAEEDPGEAGAGRSRCRGAEAGVSPLLERKVAGSLANHPQGGPKPHCTHSPPAHSSSGPRWHTSQWLLPREAAHLRTSLPLALSRGSLPCSPRGLPGPCPSSSLSPPDLLGLVDSQSWGGGGEQGFRLVQTSSH